MQNNFLDIADISSQNLYTILNLSLEIKQAPQLYRQKLHYKKMILLLEKNSTRTHISFQFAMEELGGHCCTMNAQNTQVARGESISDTAKTIERFADIIAYRTSSHERLIEMKNGCKKSVVVNALTDHSHPCQIMADIMTFMEQFGTISGKTICWIGDVNNVLQSWIDASEKLNFTMNICCPANLKNKLVEKIGKNKNCHFIPNKLEAAKNAHAITTDTWTSMGSEKRTEEIFEGFTVNKEVFELASPNAIFLHCLPAYRGKEVSSEIMDNGKYSKIVFDEAENRLHIQKAIIMWCLNIN